MARSTFWVGLWLLLCMRGRRLATCCSCPPSAPLGRRPLFNCVKASGALINHGPLPPTARPTLLRLGGGYDPDEDPPPFQPRCMWMPGDQEEMAHDVDQAWEDRQQQREEDMEAEGETGLPAGMSVGQARERVELVLAAESKRKEREEVLHQQLAQHIQRLKDAHAQIMGGAQPCPPEIASTTHGSPHRLRQRSRPPPGESPAPAGAGEASAGTAGRAAVAQAQAQHAEHGDKLQAIKASTDWKVEGTEERVLQHRQDVARKVLGVSPEAGSVYERSASVAPQLNSSQQQPQATQSR